MTNEEKYREAVLNKDYTTISKFIEMNRAYMYDGLDLALLSNDYYVLDFILDMDETLGYYAAFHAINLNTITHIIQNRSIDVNVLFIDAAVNNNILLMKFLINKGYPVRDETFIEATSHNKPLIMTMWQHTILGWDGALRLAIKANDVETARFFIRDDMKSELDNINGLIIQASEQEYVDMVNMLLEEGMTDIGVLFEDAAGCGSLALVRQIMENYNDLPTNEATFSAAINSRIDILQYFLEEGNVPIRVWEDCLIVSSSEAEEDVVLFILEHFHLDEPIINEAFQESVLTQNIRLIQLFLSLPRYQLNIQEALQNPDNSNQIIAVLELRLPYRIQHPMTSSRRKSMP